MTNTLISRSTARLLAVVLLTGLSCLRLTAEEKTKVLPDQATYEAIGMMIAHGSGLHKMGFEDSQVEAILIGLKKGFSLEKIPAEMQALQPKVQAIMMEKMQAVRQAAQAEQAKDALINKEKAKEFFALLASQEGVKQDPAGFYYEILKPGNGAAPTWRIPYACITTAL